MKKITKKDSKLFVDKVLKMLKEYNINEIKDSKRYGHYFEFNDFECGKIEITVPFPMDQEYCYTIFVKFDNPELAHFQCNKYTGKYNFHYVDIKQILRDFTGFLAFITAGN